MPSNSQASVMSLIFHTSHGESESLLTFFYGSKEKYKCIDDNKYINRTHSCNQHQIKKQGMYIKE